MRLSIVMGLAVILLMGADAPKDQDALQGTWKLSSGKGGGKALTANQIKGGKLVVKGDRYMVTLAGRGTVKGRQKIDPAKDPKTIDIVDASGPDKGKTRLGIYELKEGEYRVVFAPPGQPRPTKFTTAPASGQWLHVWRRVKK